MAGIGRFLLGLMVLLLCVTVSTLVGMALSLLFWLYVAGPWFPTPWSSLGRVISNWAWGGLVVGGVIGVLGSVWLVRRLG